MLSAITLTAQELINTNTAADVREVNNCRIERYSILSKAMNKPIRLAVVLPPSYSTSTNKYPVLYALHGRNAPYDTWANMYPLHKALKINPMIVVCFDADKASWYMDSPELSNSQFETFFFKELIPYIDSTYNTYTNKKAVTGFSMGGFGAFRYAAQHPELFSSVSGLSSAFYDSSADSEKQRNRFTLILGSQEKHPERYIKADSYILIQKVIDSEKNFPPAYLHCGTEDFLLDHSRKMNAFLKSRKQQSELIESAGAHNWTFWKNASTGVIEFHAKHF